MKQLVVVSTFYQAVCVAAAVDSGAIPGAEERVLIVADGALAPELARPFVERDDFQPLLTRFDRVVDLGALMYPLRPVQFAPRADERPLWNSVLRKLWQLDDAPVEIYMDAMVNSPSVALARIFHDALLHLHADGLMVYSPTRQALELPVGQRIRSLVHLDMAPGVRPQMLREWHPELRRVDPAALRQVFAELSAQGPVAAGSPEPYALILGQYLTALGLISDQENIALHEEMLDVVVHRGLHRVVLKPHPAAPATSTHELVRAAARRGLQLDVDRTGRLAEVVYTQQPPALVLSCFSTGLVTARQVFGLDAVAVGTGDLLPRLAPYQNSNRMPLVLADALYADDAPEADDLDALVTAIAYCMQPMILEEQRGEVSTLLTTLSRRKDVRIGRYFKRRRLGKLGLAGGIPTRPKAWPVRTLVKAVPPRWRRGIRDARESLRARGAAESTAIRP